jgi:acetyltransferase-like isoleucine patch superfamily enzyme
MIYTNSAYPQFKIGKHTYGLPQVLYPECANLEIGAFCAIADHVRIFLGGEHRADWVTTYPFSKLWEQAKHIEGHPGTKGDVIIGNDVWIGIDSRIFSGVKIGNGAVIGSGAYVVQDVPDYAIVFGNPAKVMRYRFPAEIIKELQVIAWWNWEDEKIAEFLPLMLSNQINEFIRKAQ